MAFIDTTTLINEKVKNLKLPYFNCVVKQNGETVYKYSYSKKDSGNDLLLMYSMSKPITAVALLQLAQKGLVTLDDKVGDYLPGFDSFKLLNSEESYSNPITIKNLLSMTSGLDYNLGRKAIIDLVKSKPSATTLELCSVFAKDGVNFVPGTQFQYSLSVDVVAAIVEKVTGLQFSDYVNENIFKPLGMNNSSFKQDQALMKKARDEYEPNHKGGLKIADRRMCTIFYPNKKYESGGAGLISTVSDYSLFADSLANRTNKIIDDSLVDQMDTVIVSDTPFNEDVKEYSKKSEDYGYGLAVRVRKRKSKNNIPEGEFGWDGATGSYSLIDRKNKISIVMGLTVQAWPDYLKAFHIEIVESIYKDLEIE